MPCSPSKRRRRRLAELRIKVTPKSSRNLVEPGEPVKVYVTSPPADGEANKALGETLSKALGVPKSRIEIVKGQTSRDKTVVVQGLSDEERATRLAALRRS